MRVINLKCTRDLRTNVGIWVSLDLSGTYPNWIFLALLLASVRVLKLHSVPDEPAVPLTAGKKRKSGQNACVSANTFCQIKYKSILSRNNPVFIGHETLALRCFAQNHILTSIGTQSSQCPLMFNVINLILFSWAQISLGKRPSKTCLKGFAKKVSNMRIFPALNVSYVHVKFHIYFQPDSLEQIIFLKPCPQK